MEVRKSRFDDHMSTIESAHSKNASASHRASAGNDLLSKLAAELGLGDEKNQAAVEGAKGEVEAGAAAGTSVTDPKAPTAEGEVIPAAAAITGAAAAVSEATDAVAMPQVQIAGGVPAVMEAGSAPNPQPVVMPIISAADGNAQTANDLGRTAQSVIEAAQPTSKGEEAEAEKIGRLIAKSFQAEIEKTAKDEEYASALRMLKEAGFLNAYNIKDSGLEKTAAKHEGFLEKIAANMPLTRDDIIGAAYELVEFNKQAADVEAEGREAAQGLVTLMKKVAEEAKVEAAAEEKKEEEAEEAAEEKKEEEMEEKEASVKLASLMSDPKVVSAVKVLKAKGLI